MLGIEKINIVIKEPFASQIRDKLKRYRNNELNEEEQRPDLPFEVKNEVEIQVKYEGYINLEQKQVEKSKRILKKYNAIWVD